VKMNFLTENKKIGASKLRNNVLVTVSILFFLGILALLFLRNTLFFSGNYIIQGADLVQTYYPKLYYKASLLNSTLPLWNPYIYSGYPFLAHPYNGVFYPLNLLFLIMPVHIGYSWIFALHIFLAGIFMFFLVNYLVKDRFAAFVSAIAFMFSGYAANKIWAGHFEIYASSIWIPLVFLFFLKAIKRKSILFAVLTGASLAVQFFAGHTQTFFFTLLILAAYIAYSSFWDVVFCVKSLVNKVIKRELCGSDSEFIDVLKNTGIRLLLFGVALLFFVIISAIQLFPTFELIKLSTRGAGHPFFMSAYGSFPPEHIIRFLIPDFFGNILKTLYAGDPILGEIHWAFTYYIGIIPLIMAIYGIWKGLNEKAGKALLFVTLFVFLVSVLTRFAFLQLWQIRNNPGGNNPFITSVVRFFEQVYTGEVSIWRLIPFPLMFFIGMLFIFRYVKQRFIDPVKVTYETHRMILFFTVLCLAGFILALGQYSGGLYYLLYKFIPGYDKFRLPARHLIICNFSLCILAGYGMVRLKERSYVKFGLIALILVDLFLYGNKYLYLKNLDEFFPDKRIVNYIHKDRDIYRILTLPVIKPGCVYEPSCAEFQANACIPLHMYNITGYDPLILRRYHEFTNTLQHLPLNNFGSVSIKIKDLSNENFLKLLNIKYIFARSNFREHGLGIENMKLVANFGRSCLLLSNDYLPRFMFVQNTVVADDDSEIRNIIKSKDFDPKKYLVLEARQSPVVLNNKVLSNHNSQIEIINYSPNQIDIEVSVDSRGYLASSEVYYPGWRAFINDKEVKVYRSNYAFRAVFIPSPGKYRVQFRFEPKSLKRGRLITFLGLCFAVFYCILYSRKKLRSKLRLR